jgi:transcriptional regulator with XRE-family HTH domain
MTIRKEVNIVARSLPMRLRVLRAERRVTLREVEEATGVAKETLSDLERGKRRPKDITLAKLADFYGVPVETLLEAEEPALPLAEAPLERPPAVPLTSEPRDMFARRLRRADTERKARELRDALDVEMGELARYRDDLKRRNADTGPVQPLLKAARKRYRDAAFAWAGFVVEGDEERQRSLRRARVEESGEAS